MANSGIHDRAAKWLVKVRLVKIYDFYKHSFTFSYETFAKIQLGKTAFGESAMATNMCSTSWLFWLLLQRRYEIGLKPDKTWLLVKQPRS
jgi:hypothetical protein